MVSAPSSSIAARIAPITGNGFRLIGPSTRPLRQYPRSARILPKAAYPGETVPNCPLASMGTLRTSVNWAIPAYRRRKEPGRISIGGRAQNFPVCTPALSTEDVVAGNHLFATERLWFLHPGVDHPCFIGRLSFAHTGSVLFARFRCYSTQPTFQPALFGSQVPPAKPEA